MNQKQLIELGFKKKKYDEYYWFELRHNGHVFLTNDDMRNNGNDKWFVGYQDKWNKDGFWFNEKLSDVDDFKTIFKVLTGSKKYLKK